MARTQIGQILKEQGVINDKQLAEALSHQRGRSVRLGEALVELGFADEAAVAKALARQQRRPFIVLGKGGNIPKEILDRIPENIVEEYGILPLMIKGGKLAVAVDDPAKVFSLDELRFVLNIERYNPIAKVYGEDTDNWPGKRVILFKGQTKFGREQVDCVAVRIPDDVPF